MSGGRSRGTRRSGRRRRRKRPRSAARGGGGGGGQGRGGVGAARPARPAAGANAGGGEESFPGESRLLCRLRTSPGPRGARAAGPASCGVGPGLTGRSVPVPGRGAGRVPCEPGRARVSALGSRPVRLPPRPRVWGASRRAALGPAARGVLGGAGRRSPPLARCLPALSLPDSRPGKVSSKGAALPDPQPGTRPGGTALLLPRASSLDPRPQPSLDP